VRGAWPNCQVHIEDAPMRPVISSLEPAEYTMPARTLTANTSDV